MAINIAKIVESVYRDMLPAFSEEEIKEISRDHRANNPELYGYVWDEESGDWILTHETGMNRMIDRTGRASRIESSKTVSYLHTLESCPGYEGWKPKNLRYEVCGHCGNMKYYH